MISDYLVLTTKFLKEQNHCRIIGRHKQELVYSDPNTYSGPDEQTVFDFDDELVVMAKDLGVMRPAKSVTKPKYVLQVSQWLYKKAPITTS